MGSSQAVMASAAADPATDGGSGSSASAAVTRHSSLRLLVQSQKPASASAPASAKSVSVSSSKAGKQPPSEQRAGAAAGRTGFAGGGVGPAAARAEKLCATLVTREMLAECEGLLEVTSGKMRGTEYTRRLLSKIGGPDAVVSVTSCFYDKMFQDARLDQFVTSHRDPHGERLGLWIVEKMGGGDVWTRMRPPDARQRAHYQAWHCPKRAADRLGSRFKLDDCRMWMRLMFWAARERLAAEHTDFFTWYVLFLGHFIAVYERSAPPYALEAANWSADPANIKEYIENGRLMADIPRSSRY